jgi:hypothetical protein
VTDRVAEDAVWDRAVSLAREVYDAGPLALRPDLLAELAGFLREWRGVEFRPGTDFTAPVMEALARRGLTPLMVEVAASMTGGVACQP